jgi:hypothetical protein
MARGQQAWQRLLRRLFGALMYRPHLRSQRCFLQHPAQRGCRISKLTPSVMLLASAYGCAAQLPKVLRICPLHIKERVPAAMRSRQGGRPLSPKAGSSATADVGMRNSSPARWVGRFGASAGSLKNGSWWTTRRRPWLPREASSWSCAGTHTGAALALVGAGDGCTDGDNRGVCECGGAWRTVLDTVPIVLQFPSLAQRHRDLRTSMQPAADLHWWRVAQGCNPRTIRRLSDRCQAGLVAPPACPTLRPGSHPLCCSSVRGDVRGVYVVRRGSRKQGGHAPANAAPSRAATGAGSPFRSERGSQQGSCPRRRQGR